MRLRPEIDLQRVPCLTRPFAQSLATSLSPASVAASRRRLKEDLIP